METNALTYKQFMFIAGAAVAGLFSVITLLISQYFAHINLKATHRKELEAHFFKDKLDSLKTLVKSSHSLLLSFCTIHSMKETKADDIAFREHREKHRQILNDFGTAFDLSRLYLNDALASKIEELFIKVSVITGDTDKTAKSFARIHEEIINHIKKEFNVPL